ncbi:hypothetical protein ADU90_01845 [Clostridium botulinum]|uniref:Uncharacterized protein n=1 Tax=Clostridium botulinum C/D str. DC5 TaxID=1443128 RepID=A0A0A0IEG9_CLOBO|nr:tetratricopeptide repeat protein [Clostridium botulinum]KGM93289.1 hypothetical protein Z956_12105 [Clostridium botulinum D str. CCUG 7971]KGM99849.1 hypothetical protein Z955_05905 [Clostridium botulinum C/D str. DC5]KOC49339.1 hypothetical protein ADU88_05815 [Clostridium botulinum]KOC56697.1 hypothetical protein ADU89_02105 [Clostridium botulinum]KOC58133.1 hypothetical protein ADU90_01845 [Clostridium botulinum]
MGFFNSIKKMVLKKSSDGDFRKDLQKIDNTELGVLTKAVNLTLDNYRKSIDKISTKVSSTEYENDFYNYNMNIKKIDNIEIDIKEINGEIQRVYDKNKELEESIKLLTQQILESEVQLDKLREEQDNLKSKTNLNKLNDEEKEDVREDIFNVVESTKSLEEKIINLKVKVDVSTMDIRANEELICNHKHEIENKKNEKLCLMILSNSLDECLKFAEDIEEKTSFTKYCFQGLLNYNKGEYKEALNNFDNYFKREEEPYENYYIREIYAKLLIENNRYEEAKQYAMEALKDKPEEIEIHKILSKVHKVLGEEEEQMLEDSIVYMLEG